MRTLKILCLCLILFASSTFAKAINLWAEPMWLGKDVVLHSARPNIDGDTIPINSKSMWGFGANLSLMPSSNIAIGPTASFSWSNFRETGKGETADTVHSRELIIMIPLALTITIDPIPQYKIHPTGHLSLGYNSVFIHNREDAQTFNRVDDFDINAPDGYYNGVFIKFGADVMVDLGKQFSIFAGPQMQISEVARRSSGLRTTRNFNQTGFRFGVSILL